MYFNADKAKDEIIAWIKDWFENKSGNAQGVIIGLSGGKDSTVCAKLLVEALGKEKVLGLLMPKGVNSDFIDSIKVAQLLGIPYLIHDITEVVSTVVKTASAVSKDETHQKLVEGNLQCRTRMMLLYYYAQEASYRVCGTGNLSERLLTYSTKWGDAAHDFNPIANLSKREVCLLGIALGLPREFVYKAPADGLTGKTDEEVLGITYDEVDQFIDCLKYAPEGAAEKYLENYPEVKEKLQYRLKIGSHKLDPVPICGEDILPQIRNLLK